MYEKWVRAASDGKISGAVFVDLSAAFDLVSPDILLKKLDIYGLDESFQHWIKDYLTNRYQAAWIDHCFSSYLPCEFGVPQGSILGPLIFLVYVNDLAYQLTCPLEQYADDTTMSESHKSIEMLSSKLTKKLSIIE